MYVFVRFRAGEDDRFRISELGTRCFLARQKVGKGDTVIGVGIGQYAPSIGAPSDLIYIDTSRWSAADEERALLMKKELGFFAKAAFQHSHEKEYPTSV